MIPFVDKISRSVQKQSYILAAILLLALTLRLLVFRQIVENPQRAMLSDSFGYEELAIGLLQRGEFDNVLRTPAYPAFIASIYAVFGTERLPVLLAQIVLDCASIVLIFRLAGRQHKQAWLPALLWAANPAAIVYANRIMSETPFVFFLLAMAYMVSRFLAGSRMRDSVFAGLLLGLATLTRPVAQYMILILLVYILIIFHKDKKKVLHIVLSLTAGFALIITPWMLRNKITHHRFIISTTGEFNLFARFAAYTLDWRDGMQLPQAEQNLMQQVSTQLGYDISASDFYRDAAIQGQLEEKAIDVLLENWPWFIISTVQGVALTLILPPVGMGEMQKLFSADHAVDEFKLYTLKTNPADIGYVRLIRVLQNRLAGMPVSVIAIWSWSVLYLIFFYVYVLYRFYIDKSGTPWASCLFLALGLYLITIPGPMGLARFRLVAEPLLLAGK